jgi:YVTN family beta-propeller protein
MVVGPRSSAAACRLALCTTVAVLVSGCSLGGGRTSPAPAAATGGPRLVQAPALSGAPAVGSDDRVYTADQVSNTVTVVEPASGAVLGTIPMGTARLEDDLGATYYGELDTHGLGFSPDGRTLVVVNVTSNGVAFVDTATNHVRRIVSVGRAPHEAAVTPDGREAWVAVRGEDYVSVLDLRTGRELRRITTAPGPSMVAFTPDGRSAFVNHARSPVLVKVDTKSHRVVGRIDHLASPFSPNLAVSPDGAEVWLTHKDVGKVTVVDARRLAVRTVLDTGGTTNHVNFVTAPGAGYAYVTVAGLDEILVYRRSAAAPELAATVPAPGGPHGVWPSPDNRHVYVGLEGANALDVLDASDPAHPQVTATLPIGQAPQAVVYVAGAVPAGPGTAGLGRQGLGRRVQTARLVDQGTRGTTQVVVRELSGVDMIEVVASGLPPGAHYTLWAEGPGPARPVVRFTADDAGKAKAMAFSVLFGVAEHLSLRPA